MTNLNLISLDLYKSEINQNIIKLIKTIDNIANNETIDPKMRISYSLILIKALKNRYEQYYLVRL